MGRGTRGVTCAEPLCPVCESPTSRELRDAILDLHRDVVAPLVDAPNDDWAHLGGLQPAVDR